MTRRRPHPPLPSLADALKTAVKILLLGGFVWVLATPRDGKRAWRRECGERYARAATRADTIAVDRHPVAVGKRGPLYCYRFRLDKLL